MSTNGQGRILAIPHDWYRQMRKEQPVYFDPRFQLWNIFTYDEALQVLLDLETFSSEPAPGSRQLRLPSILGMDEPRHRKLRGIVQTAFTPRHIAQLEPRIIEVTDGLLDRVADQRKMDVIADLAYPLPITIIAELLGVPPEEQDLFKDWSTTMVSGPRHTTTLPEERIKIVQQLQAYLGNKLEEHRRQPREDLMTRLLEAEVDGEQLNQEELIDFCQLLLVAGYETTANLLGNAFVCFDEHPEVVEELRAEPGLMKSAVEEILRCYPSVSGAARLATREATIGGQTIEANQAVSISIASANYDEKQFPDPERFNIRREPNRHLSFGHGIHFCLGAPLARLEASLALNLVFKRLRDIRRDPEQEVKAIQTFFTYGVESFPVTFKPA